MDETPRRVAAVLLTLGLLSTLGCGSDAASEGDVAFRSVSSANIDTGSLPTPPALIVTRDGVVVLPAPPSAAIEGQLLPTVWTVRVTPTGLERLLDVPSGVEPFAGPADQHYAELAKIVGAEELGESAYYLPDDYLFVATPATETAGRPVVDWPDFATIALVDSAGCQRLPEVEVGEVFETAAAGSLFADDGVLYDVTALQAWPGATC